LRHGIRHIIATYHRLQAQPRNLLAIGILLTIVTLGSSSGHLPITAGANADSHALISLYTDGQQRLFTADAKTVADVLRRANVKLSPNDLVEPTLHTPVPSGQFNINIYRSRTVIVEDGLQNHLVNSAYQSPRLLALASGLIVYPEDRFRTEIVTDFVGSGAVGERVVVTRAKSVNLSVDGKSRLIRTQSPTLKSALIGAGVALGPQDTTSVPLTQNIIPGMTVAITRVTEATVNLTEILPRPVTTIADPTVLKGQSSVKQPGSDGQKTVTYRIHYQDGVETARQSLQTVSETQPTPKIVVEGTKVIFAGSIEYWRPQVEAAAARYGVDPNMMLRIMNCESHGNASSISSFVVNGEHPTGLFQFLPSTWTSNGGTSNNILDGSVQVQIAAKKMASEGTKAWQCK
jgi:uncharacterized protein YabE (DUF348 family)